LCERSAFRTATVNGTVYFGPWSLIASALSLDRPSLAQLRAEFPCAFQPLGDGREFAVSSVGLTDIACAYGRAVQLLMSVPETPKYACPLRAFDRWLQQPRVCARPGLIRAVSCVWSADTAWLPNRRCWRCSAHKIQRTPSGFPNPTRTRTHSSPRSTASFTTLPTSASTFRPSAFRRRS